MLRSTPGFWCIALILVGAPACSTPEAPGGGAAAPTREQAAASGKNVEAICRAAITYDDTKNGFPLRAVMADDGQPGLSWRVAILPYLGEEPLYRQFKLDEPWDSAHNRPLIAKMPAVYRSPLSRTADGMTNYLGIVGPQSVFGEDRSVTMAGVSDGTANTIMVVEVDDDRAVEWTKPADHSPDSANPAEGLGGMHPKGVFIAGFVSGAVRFVPTADSQSLAAMFTRNGKEPFQWDAFEKQHAGAAR